jgi:signal transduction histidine kinase
MASRNENLEVEVDKRTRELVDYNHQLEQFAFIASHNLRAPVATLLGLGHLLEVSTGDKEEVDQICKNMITTSRELDRVVRDLSTILEIRNSSQAILSEINLDDEVRLVRVNLDRELTETGAALVTDFSAVPSLFAVRPLVDSILMNLISNAVKYRHPDRPPHIVVRTEQLQGEVCLSVSDNGMGMDLETYGDKLFTLYGRFHSHVDGKGLGLYLVKTHVTAMGGRVEVESVQDQGSTFRVFLKDLRLS